jgi:hypothetical protein
MNNGGMEPTFSPSPTTKQVIRTKTKTTTTARSTKNHIPSTTPSMSPTTNKTAAKAKNNKATGSGPIQATAVGGDEDGDTVMFYPDVAPSTPGNYSPSKPKMTTRKQQHQQKNSSSPRKPAMSTMTPPSPSTRHPHNCTGNNAESSFEGNGGGEGGVRSMSTSQRTVTHPNGRRELIITTKLEKFDGSIETKVERRTLMDNVDDDGGAGLRSDTILMKNAGRKTMASPTSSLSSSSRMKPQGTTKNIMKTMISSGMMTSPVRTTTTTSRRTVPTS